MKNTSSKVGDSLLSIKKELAENDNKTYAFTCHININLIRNNIETI